MYAFDVLELFLFMTFFYPDFRKHPKTKSAINFNLLHHVLHIKFRIISAVDVTRTVKQYLKNSDNKKELN